VRRGQPSKRMQTQEICNIVMILKNNHKNVLKRMLENENHSRSEDKIRRKEEELYEGRNY
jgi:hypothetical protein